MYEYVPKRKNKKALILVAMLILITAAGFLSAELIPAYRWTVQLLAIAAAALAVLLCGRYLLKEYTYRIEEQSGGIDFVVIERQGKRGLTVCKIGTNDILEAYFETPENKNMIAKKGRQLRRYDYCVDLGADGTLCLFVREGDETVAVRISPDDKIASILLSQTSENAGLAKNENDPIR